MEGSTGKSGPKPVLLKWEPKKTLGSTKPSCPAILLEQGPAISPEWKGSLTFKALSATTDSTIKSSDQGNMFGPESQVLQGYGDLVLCKRLGGSYRGQNSAPLPGKRGQRERG